SVLRSHTPLFLSFNSPSPSALYSLSLHDALPILFDLRWRARRDGDADVIALPNLLPGPPCLIERRTFVGPRNAGGGDNGERDCRSEEHTSELQSLTNIVCRLLLEKKKTNSSATGY